jgi:NAD(P)H dehydrogenase (quinone)
LWIGGEVIRGAQGVQDLPRKESQPPVGLLVHEGAFDEVVHVANVLTALVPLIHLGMEFVGTPYGQNPQLLVTDGIGGSPYGPGTLAGTDGSRQPVKAELTTARNLGSRLARVAGRLKDLRVSRASAP